MDDRSSEGTWSAYPLDPSDDHPGRSEDDLRVLPYEVVLTAGLTRWLPTS